MTDPNTATLARIRQMADYWEQNLPEVIRTPAVVSALRAALESAAPVLPEPADRAAVLREAADHAETVALRLRLKHDVGAANGAYEVMAELRRMADETATTETPAAVRQDGSA